MPNKLNTEEIENTLISFENSDISDFDDEEEEENGVLESLLQTLNDRNNNAFLIEELTNPEGNSDQFEKNLDLGDDLMDLEDASDPPFKKIISYRWAKAEWNTPISGFSESYPKQDVKTPVSYFLKYFPYDFIDTIVQATNQASLMKSGTAVNVEKEEILTLMGLEIIIGTIGYPRLQMYWAGATQITAFRKHMTKKRFHIIRTCIKFCVEGNSTDKLFKVLPLINTFLKKSYDIPKDENCCCDEMMIPCKSKTGLKQYMPKKPIKWGIKIFCLCSSNGIVYDLEIYQGKNTIVGDSKLGFCSDIVIHLCKTIPENKNHKIFFDNYFTTINLLIYLRGKGIWATGTIRGNRIGKAPLKPEKDLKKLGRGSYDYCIERNQNIIVLKWLDGGCVQLASSIYGDKDTKEVTRFCSEQKKRIVVSQPNVIAVYNKYMGGVDKMDFLLSLYRISIRTKKWTLRVFDHFLDLAVGNSWLEYRNDCESNNIRKKDQMNLLAFRNDVADGLLALATVQSVARKRGRPKQSEDLDLSSTPSTSKSRPSYERAPSGSIRFDGIQHWPEYTPVKRICKVPGCKGYSRYLCAKCNVHLCIPNGTRNCFRLYHEK